MSSCFPNLDKNLQLMELLSPDGRGETPCFHLSVASEDSEKDFLGSSDSLTLVLLSGVNIVSPTGDISHSSMV